MGWSDETVAKMQREIIESAFRPRDEFDIDVHPDSLRGRVLAHRDAVEAVWAEIGRLPWYRRWPLRLLMRLKGIRP